MSGLIALVVLFIWGFICYQLSKLLMKKIASPIAKNFGIGFLLLLFFLLPVADDIIGGFQFRSLCKEDARMFIDEGKAKGTTVYFVGNDVELFGYILPITKKTWSYKDAHTKEVVISWNEYRAKGGWLSHVIGFPQGNPPYTFNGVCYPVDSGSAIFDKLNIKKLKEN